MFRCVLVIVILLVVMPSGVSRAAEPESFVVNFNRPIRAGERATIEIVTAELTTSTRAWHGGKPHVDETPVGYRFVAAVDPIEPDKDGIAQARRYTVRTFTVNRGKSDRQVLSRGAKIVARLPKASDEDGEDNETRLTVDGKAPSGEVETALRTVVWFSSQKREDRWNEIYGSVAKRRIGERWPLDRDGLIEMYCGRRMIVQPDDISAYMKLTGIETYNGERCLKVEGWQEIEHFVQPDQTDQAPRRGRRKQPATAPAQWEWDVATMATSMSCLLPLDQSRPVPQTSWSSTVTYRMQGEQNGFGYSNEHVTQREAHFRVVPAEEVPSSSSSRTSIAATNAKSTTSTTRPAD